MKTFVIDLGDERADLAVVGGKGASLTRLFRSGLPVPEGFHVTTAAYDAFTSRKDFCSKIENLLKQTESKSPETVELVSRKIMNMFEELPLPGDIAESILTAYNTLSQGDSMDMSRRSIPCKRNIPQDPRVAAVAVRSSATAEDLPGASFAGQQDSFLNVRGGEAVLEAVKKCWASLWTGRAITYRMKQGIPSNSVSIAVVVQRLVPAEAAGIMFTADPLTGSRAELVINAAWGLGEAVVGGLVTPDAVTVEKDSGRVRRKEIALKEKMTVRTEAGTMEQVVPKGLRRKAVLNRRQAARLAVLGSRIESLYGTPMDIEWTYAKNRFAIVQARPITTLEKDLPEWTLPRSGGVYIRSSVVDLMPDPLSPLFASLTIPAITRQLHRVGTVMTHRKPRLPEDYYTTINGYAYMNVGFDFRSWCWIIFGVLPAYPGILRRLIPYWRDEALPRYQEAVEKLGRRPVGALSPREIWESVVQLSDEVGLYTAALLYATMGASAGSEALLTKLYDKMLRREGDPPASVLLMGWDSIPARAEKALFDIARQCVEDTKTPVLTSESPEDVQKNFTDRFRHYLDLYGHMIFELDYSKPLPKDDPSPMLEVVRMYMRGEGTNPYERQAVNEKNRRETAEACLMRLRGPRRWIFRKVLNWAQSLSEVREDALAEIGTGYPLIREMLHRLGEILAESGDLEQPEDIYLLEKDEIAQTFTHGDELDGGLHIDGAKALISGRKAFLKKMKKVSPPQMLPPKKKLMGFDTGLFLASTEGNRAGFSLSGVAASAGRVTAKACVMDGPEHFGKMQPGSIIVAATTTPAWTPLFAMAAGVVTDIGGPLSHGSIVAREYGIPAVMGTGVATRRIEEGQTVTVDGNTGTVLLEPVGHEDGSR